MSIQVPSIKLKPTDALMPQVGLGLWKIPKDTCAEQVYNAIKVGYRLFDGAQDYDNEREAGEGIRKAISNGLVKREELFVVTKVWSTFHGKYAIPSIKDSLERFGLGYFDLVYLHFPVALEYVDPKVRFPPGWAYDGKDDVRYAKIPFYETYRYMEQAVEQGLIKHIGLSNWVFGAMLIDTLNCANIPPAALQIEHHPYLVQPQLIELAKERDLAITAYASFGPQSFRELEWKKATDAKLLFEAGPVVAAAKAHSRTPAQVLLRWATQRGLAVIPKSNNPERLKQNLDCCSFNLSEKEIRAISALDQGLRFNDPADYSSLKIFA